VRETSLSTKALRARELGVSLRSLYYRPKKPDKDWQLKCRIEEVLREHPSYGSRRISIHLQLNRKRVKRVMNLFGIKAYRRRGRKWKKTKNIKVIYPNLLLTEYPSYPNHIWTADLTMNALHNNSRPIIFHSDNGSEYNADIFIEALQTVGAKISRSDPGCPWENGYQESFHSQFKVDFGDPSRSKI
jgi:putative transposase